jgi:hypothetical protein
MAIKDRTYAILLDWHNAEYIIQGSTSEARAWKIAEIFLKSLQEEYPHEEGEIVFVEPDWRVDEWLEGKR